MNRIDNDGMDWVITTEQKDGKTIYHITVNAALYNNSSTNYSQKQMNQLADKIKSQCMAVFNTSGKGYTVDFKMNLSVAKSVDDIKSTDHVYQIVDQKVEGGNLAQADPNNSLNIQIGTRFVNGVLGITNDPAVNIRTVAHELGHTGGLDEANKGNAGVTDIRHNIMAQSYYVLRKGIPLNEVTQLTQGQINMITNNYNQGKLNTASPIEWQLKLKVMPPFVMPYIQKSLYTNTYFQKR
jgi:hypothetical protein